jgi:biopolymer transport protein TolR
MAGSVSSRGIKNDINVTPLIDVVLVLLIIFMVVTPMLERGKSVQLPRSQTRDEQNESDALILSLPGDHSIWLDETQVSKEVLASRLSQLVAERPGRKVLLKADRSLKVGVVREVLALTKAAGIGDITLGIDEKEAAP